MNGVINNYIENKGYGFIQGENGESYFFHKNELKTQTDVRKLKQGASLSFDVKMSPKGEVATGIVVADLSRLDAYELPSEFIQVKDRNVRGWNIMEHPPWRTTGSSSDTIDDAKAILIHNAKWLGANALVDVQYSKSKGEDGNYIFSIHHFTGTPVVLGRKAIGGEFTARDFRGLAEQISVEKENYNKAYQSKKTRVNIVRMDPVN